MTSPAVAGSPTPPSQPTPPLPPIPPPSPNPPTSFPAPPSLGAAVVAPMSVRPGVRPYRFRDVVHSEWTKIRTVRSTWFTLLATVVIVVGLGALIGEGVGSHYHNASFSDKATFDPTQISFFSLLFGQLAIAVLAVLVVSSEYGTGMIRTSLQAVPNRTWFLGAKVVVFTAVALVVGEVLSFATYFVVQPLLKAGPAPHSTLGQPHVLRAVVGAGLYLTVSGLLSLGIAALIRHTAGAITIVVAVYFVLPGVSNALPSNWEHTVQEFLPTGAGEQIFSVLHQQHYLTAWVGFGVMCAYAAVVLAVAGIVLNRRDA
jgi:ABC-2 type transport system permease protein